MTYSNSPKTTLPSTIQIPEVDSLKARFSFVGDEILQTNLAITFKYIIFLVSLDEEFELGSLTYSIYKDIVVQTAIIHKAIKVEGDKYIQNVYRETKYEKLNRSTTLDALNRVAKRCGLYDDEHFKIAQKLRDKRNRIHLAGLTSIDDQYSKDEINSIFADANKLITRIEMYVPTKYSISKDN